MPASMITHDSKSIGLALLVVAFLQPAAGWAQDCPHREYAWTKTVGGERGEYVLAGTAVDINGQVLIAGQFGGKIDFDPGPYRDHRRPRGMGDAFVSWYSRNGEYGGSFTFGATRGSRYLFDSAFALAARPTGGFVVGGIFNGRTDFDPTDARDARWPDGLDDGFISSFSGNYAYDWTWTFGGESYDAVWAASVAPTGSVVVAGTFYERIFLGEGESRRELNSNGDMDIVIAELSASGQLLWFTAFGGPGRDFPYGVVVDSEGGVAIAGGFRETVDFDPDGEHAMRTSHGDEDVFLLRLTADGRFDWIRTFGGLETDNPLTIIAGTNGGLYLAGAFSGLVDFNPEGGGDLHDSSPADYHAFISRYAPDGSCVWTRTFGGMADTYTKGLALSGDRLIHTGGYFGQVDLDPGAGFDEHAPLGERTCYVSYWNLDGIHQLGDVFGGQDMDRTMGIAAGADGSVYVAGDFISPVVDFDPTAGISEAINQGSADFFLSKFNCGECEFLDRHDVEYDGALLRSTVYTLAPGGRLTVRLLSNERSDRKSKVIGEDGVVNLRFEDLPAGEYEVAVQRVRDVDGNKLCKGEMAKRRIVIP